MSLIIAYIGKKGCVMASDKRKIGYFGNKENLEILENELYNAVIRDDDEFLKRAEELGISIKITDDANKISIVENTIRSEVSTKGTFKTKRKRIYGTTNDYQIVELLGSEVSSRQAGKSGIIIFGNKFAKQKAETLINRYWKSSQSLKYMGEIFGNILEEISKKTPSIGSQFDILVKSPNFDEIKAQKHLDVTIDHDIKVLTKFRQKLTEELIQQNLAIEMANKIIDKGEIGKVVSIEDNMIQVELNDKTQAMNGDWKQLAAPGEKVLMFSTSDDIKLGDKVIIDNEILCLKKNKSPLSCDIILCSL